MTVFDQRGQHVTYQYNAAGDINIGGVQNRTDLIGELERLKVELLRAAEAQVISVEVATDAEYQLTKAVQQAQKPQPDKQTILQHLVGAKALIEGITAAGGLVGALAEAAKLVQGLF